MTSRWKTSPWECQDTKFNSQFSIPMSHELTQKIEAILFYSGEPVEIDFLAKTLETEKEAISSALEDLAKTLELRGLRLLVHDGQASLVTAPEHSGIIEKIIKEERERELGRASIETLAIVAYKGPVSRKEIEYIRGVNSQFALRTLLLRGLIEKKQSDESGRVMVYTITSDTLRYLGLQNIADLPEYADMQKRLEIPDESEEQSGEEDSEAAV